MAKSKPKLPKINKWVLTLIVLAGIGWWLFSFVMKYINNVPKLDEEVKASWSQVVNNYKSRADLIPNLVSTVKGYAIHEKEALTGVIEARAKATQMTIPENILTNKEAFQKFQATQSNLGAALGRLMVVVEKYPELKADKSFLGLQSQIEGIENRIRIARKDYIETVKNYNMELRTFPNKIIASIFHSDAEIRENFTAPKEVETAPNVSFE